MPMVHGRSQEVFGSINFWLASSPNVRLIDTVVRPEAVIGWLDAWLLPWPWQHLWITIKLSPGVAIRLDHDFNLFFDRLAR